MIPMVVHAHDEVNYKGHLCSVEQVWETSDETHTPFAAIRPYDQPGGMYFVEQAALQPPLHGVHHHGGNKLAA